MCCQLGYERAMSEAIKIFDRQSVRHHRARAAATYDDFSYLKDEIADRIAERLEEINREFKVVLDLGSHKGMLGRHITHDLLVSADLSREMVSAADGMPVVADEEQLPFKNGSFDLIVSNLSMHWVNDLPGAMVQINLARKKLERSYLINGLLR